jgi:hypothetical protein
MIVSLVPCTCLPSKGRDEFVGSSVRGTRVVIGHAAWRAETEGSIDSNRDCEWMDDVFPPATPGAMTA